MILTLALLLHLGAMFEAAVYGLAVGRGDRFGRVFSLGASLALFICAAALQVFR